MNAASVINRATAPHYVWGDACDGWRLCDTPGMPQGSQERRHLHARAAQVFYVLDGTLEIETGGTTHSTGRGDALTVLPHIPHQVRYTGTQDARFIVISAPSTQQDRQNL